jgi:2-methylaconitate cis-trans-isomerase PrpF
VEASVVDIANLVVFAPAETFGLTGTEDPVALENN